MKGIRYIIALVLSGVACWLNTAMNDWTLLRTFMIAPVIAYSVKVAMLAILILLVGYCCGIGFQKKSRNDEDFCDGVSGDYDCSFNSPCFGRIGCE